MACEYNFGPGWTEHKPNGLLYEKGKVLQVDGMRIIISTGGMDEPTKIFVTGCEQLDYELTGKVKPWVSRTAGWHGFNIYGNGASVSLLSPEHPYHLAVTHLPKAKI